MLKRFVMSLLLVTFMFTGWAQAQYNLNVFVNTNPETQEWFVNVLVLPGPAHSTWQPQNPGDEVLGVGSILAFLETTGGVWVSGGQMTAPVDWDTNTGFTMQALYPYGGKLMLVAMQNTVYPHLCMTGVGLFPQWLQLAKGTYGGSNGTITVTNIPPYLIGNLPNAFSMLYGNPSEGYTDPEKVDVYPTNEILIYPATIP